jgi:hypothetical protein
MTFEEVVAAFTALAKTVGGLTDLVASHEKKIAALEAQVQAHDAQLKTAPEPGPISKGT